MGLLVAGCANGVDSGEPYVQQVTATNLQATKLQIPQGDPYLVFGGSGDVHIAERVAARLEPPSVELLLKHVDSQLSEEFEACDTRDGDYSADDCKGQAVTIYVHLLAAACDSTELDGLKQFWTMFENIFGAVGPGIGASENEKSDWREGNVLKIEAFTRQLCPSRSQRTAELGAWISEIYS